jgi:enediyne biosynthesis protein E4
MRFFGFAPISFFKNTVCVSFLLTTIFCCENSEKKGRVAPIIGSEPTLTATEPLLKFHRGEEIGLDFQNHIDESFENNPTTNVNIYNGGGVAVADVNNDGLQDIYFVRSNGENKLFINESKSGQPLHFRDATAGSGLESPDGFESAVTAVDINADGWMDFYVCAAGPEVSEKCRNRLFINNQNGTFSEKAKEFGIDVETKSTGAAFFDFDLDGDLDLYLVNYPQDFRFTNQIEYKTDLKTGEYTAILDPKTPLDSDRLYQNDGKNHFTDISEKAGIRNFAYGLSVNIADFNGDHWPDIYVGNDFVQPDILYINQKNGTFKNQLADFVKHNSQHTMGVDIADFDNDNLVDFLGVDMLPRSRERLKSTMNSNSQTSYNQKVEFGYFEPVVRNVLQHNNGFNPEKGHSTFSDVSCLANVYNTDWSWSGLFMDLDNDGLKDLGITNGYRREVNDLDFFNFTFPELLKKPLKDQFSDVKDFLNLIPSYKLRNYIFKNKGELDFEDMSGKWATMTGSFSSGAAYADFDRDGDLDWVVSNVDETPFLYENLQNKQPDNHFLQIKCLGVGQNLGAFGTTATITTPDGQQQYLELNPTRGIFSSVEPLLHFGLGKNTSVSKMVIRWPDGKATTMENVPANQFMTLKWAESNGKYVESVRQAGIFNNTTVASGVNFKHIEEVYSDFDHSFLQPWKISELGPALASGDVNGDGLDDFFIGNAFDNAGAMFLQNPNGSFRKTSAPIWENDKIYEDVGAIFFDADGDKDLDLAVINGGHEATNPIAWQPRLYLNDGKGVFLKKNDGFPPISLEFQGIAANDLDGDGDLDLCLGGRLAKNYGDIPRSLILKNDGGKFNDATAQFAGDFEKTGLITDLKWANLDADPALELVAVGEWMPVSILKMVGGKLKNITQNLGLGKSNGLWQSVSVGDLDGDGDADLLTGNFGKNSRLHATETQPLELFSSDFDGNGSIEPVLTMFETDGKRFPIARHDVMLKQMPSLKKKFLYARDYGNATFEMLFSKEKIAAATHSFANNLANCWWENQNGTFICHELPNLAQVSLGWATAIGDFTGDNLPDLFIAGNKYGIEVETGRLDASVGCLLEGDGKGHFSPFSAAKSGIFADKEVRKVVVLRGANGRQILVVANNNSAIQIFSR